MRQVPAPTLRAWAAAIGDEYVITTASARRDASTATFATDTDVLAILRPASRDEVQECVRIAARSGVSLYPISSGKNWGYGSKVPARDGVLLDLGRLTRILDYDEALAYVTLEPGVTQRQLHAFLVERGGRLWMDATGASPDCSIVGNTLERGFGHTPMGDHCGNACGLEVVLPSGDVIETGFGRYSGAGVGALNRSGVGPSLDGLFAQSNLGIVTRMTVWLMPAPERFQAFFFVCRDAADLGPVIEALRPLRMNGTLRSVAHIGNDYKVLSASGQHPDRGCASNAVLAEDRLAGLRRDLTIGAWNGSGGLYGTASHVREARRQVRRALAGKVTRLHFVGDRTVAWLGRLAGPLGRLTGRDVGRTVSVIRSVLNLLKGIPTDTTLASVYWRKSDLPPASPDPDRDGCGLLWCSPVVPNTGAHLTRATDLARRLVLAHGFEPQMSVSLATERTAICVISISYDRHLAGEDERALKCHRALTDSLIEHGYPPYRLALSTMDAMSNDESYNEVLRRLKDALDPQRTIAPGRYEPPPRKGLAASGAA